MSGMDDVEGNIDVGPEIEVRQLEMSKRKTAEDFFEFIERNRREFEESGAIGLTSFMNKKAVGQLWHVRPNATFYGVYCDSALAGAVITDARPDIGTNVGVVGYLVDKEKWRQNIAARAVKAVISLHPHYEVLYAFVDENNRGSAAVAHWAGFQLEADKRGDSFGYKKTDLV